MLVGGSHLHTPIIADDTLNYYNLYILNEINLSEGSGARQQVGVRVQSASYIYLYYKD
jgi:hypothetical protein